MKKWGIVLLVIVLVGISIFTWQERNTTKYMVNILNNIPSIDSLVVIDGKTKEELIKFASKEEFFSVMVNVYKLPYYNLKWSEKKLLKEDPVLVIEYFKGKEMQYKVNVYKLSHQYKEMLADKERFPDSLSYSYIYSPNGTKDNYIFALDEHYQLVGAHEGLKEIVYKAMNINEDS